MDNTTRERIIWKANKLLSILEYYNMSDEAIEEWTSQLLAIQKGEKNDWRPSSYPTFMRYANRLWKKVKKEQSS